MTNSEAPEKRAPQKSAPWTSDESSRAGRQDVGSREVSACGVYLHIAPTLIEVGAWPLCGTPGWTALDDDDPRKLAALLNAALDWVLQQDICQEAEREASQAVSAAEDWGAIGRQLANHAEFYAARPWLKRTAS
jgi:hypothetical protein